MGTQQPSAPSSATHVPQVYTAQGSKSTCNGCHSSKCISPCHRTITGGLCTQIAPWCTCFLFAAAALQIQLSRILPGPAGKLQQLAAAGDLNQATPEALGLKFYPGTGSNNISNLIPGPHDACFQSAAWQRAAAYTTSRQHISTGKATACDCLQTAWCEHVAVAHWCKCQKLRVDCIRQHTITSRHSLGGESKPFLLGGGGASWASQNHLLDMVWTDWLAWF